MSSKADVFVVQLRCSKEKPRSCPRCRLTEPDPYPSAFAPGHATGEAKSVARYGPYELVWNSDLALHIERRARMRWISHGAIDCAASADLNAAGLQDPLALCAATFVHSPLEQSEWITNFSLARRLWIARGVVEAGRLDGPGRFRPAARPHRETTPYWCINTLYSNVGAISPLSQSRIG